MTATCHIRVVAESDLPMILSWRNHPDIRRFMFTQHEIGLDEHYAWFAEAAQDPSRRLLIVEDMGQPLGYVQFDSIAPGGVSNWGFYARPDTPKGSGAKLGITALNHAFGELDLHKVCGQAISTNVASIGFHRKIGFMQEGILRDQRRIDGGYHSLVCFGLLRHEWRTELRRMK